VAGGHVRGEGDRLLALVVVEALGARHLGDGRQVERLTISPLAAFKSMRLISEMPLNWVWLARR
jgi:hypothetical protein